MSKLAVKDVKSFLAGGNNNSAGKAVNIQVRTMGNKSDLFVHGEKLLRKRGAVITIMLRHLSHPVGRLTRMSRINVLLKTLYPEGNVLLADDDKLLVNGLFFYVYDAVSTEDIDSVIEVSR